MGKYLELWVDWYGKGLTHYATLPKDLVNCKEKGDVCFENSSYRLICRGIDSNKCLLLCEWK